jgi:hypothetical protein
MRIIDLLVLYIIINSLLLIFQFKEDLEDGEIFFIILIRMLKEDINKKGVRVWHICAYSIIIPIFMPSFIIYSLGKFIIITFSKTILHMLNIYIVKPKHINKNEVHEGKLMENNQFKEDSLISYYNDTDIEVTLARLLIDDLSKMGITLNNEHKNLIVERVGAFVGLGQAKGESQNYYEMVVKYIESELKKRNSEELKGGKE